MLGLIGCNSLLSLPFELVYSAYSLKTSCYQEQRVVRIHARLQEERIDIEFAHTRVFRAGRVTA